MKWQVNLIGDSEDLAYLSRILLSPDLLICREKDRFLLESSLFNHFSEVKDVKRETDKLLTAINATKKIVRPSSSPINRGSINAVIDDEHRILYAEGKISVSTRGRGRLTITRKDGTIDDSLPESSIPKWIPLIESDEKVQRAFKLINYDFNTHRGLCNVVEVVREDHFTPVMRQGEFYHDIDLLKETAQSYEAVGEAARHAHSKYKKPDNPMELPAAKDLVKRIVRMWLDSKI